MRAWLVEEENFESWRLGAKRRRLEVEERGASSSSEAAMVQVTSNLGVKSMVAPRHKYRVYTRL